MTSSPAPESPDVLSGLASLENGDLAAARRHFDVAIAANPYDVNAIQLLGASYLREGDIDKAMPLIERALTLRPKHIGALNNMGFCCFARERFFDAAAYFEQALALNPRNSTTHYNLGNAYFATGDWQDAERHYRTAYTLEPNYAEALGLYIHTSHMLCSWSDTAAYSALAKLARDGQYTGPPFVLLSFVDNATVHLNAARAFVKENIIAEAGAPHNKRPGRERLRVAYVSRDFSQSAIGHLIAGLFEDHDRTRFEIYGISLGPNDGSDLRRRLEKSFDHFIDVHGQPDASVAELIRRLEIDIAVDLNGHTRGNKMGVFAHRPAPVQVAYLGYSATSGSDAFDYVMVDATVVPADQQPFYTEKLWPLECYLPLDSRRPPAAATPSRAQCGLPDKGFVFCSFNNSYKLNSGMFDIWMRLLAEVEGSVLWLAAPHAETELNLRREAERRGMAPERLVFAPKIADMSEHLARYSVADLFLDTFPYNASTTASDALWMGLPVVTLSGTTYASRMAGSILRAAGLPELVTESASAYEKLALGLATDPNRLADLKARLKAARSTARLFDADRHRREIEAAFEGMIAKI